MRVQQAEYADVDTFASLQFIINGCIDTFASLEFSINYSSAIYGLLGCLID
jgi:hypothetical protein